MNGSHVSLFSGIGATDLAAEAAGFETVATAEVNPFGRAVLRARFPHASHFSDVRDMTGDDLALLRPQVQRPMLMTGGFPCQDVASLRGSDSGLSKARSGLWSEFARLIGELRPDYVLIENSPLLRRRGLDRVLLDLYLAGYEARWDCIPAAWVGAPHLRDRIWIGARPLQRPDDPCDRVWATDRWLGAVNVPLQGWYCSRHDALFGGTVVERVEHFPRAGEMQDGALGEREPQATVKMARAIHSRQGHRLFPTPRSAPNEWRTTRNAPSHGRSHGATLAGTLNDLERARGLTPQPSSESAGNIDPGVVEWFMGLPYGWTNPSVPSDALLPHDGWTQPLTPPYTMDNAPHRRQRLMALGNALLPQVAEVALTNLIDWRL